MEWDEYTTDQLEEHLQAAEGGVACLRSVQMEILEVLDHRQTATADGSRSLSEWFAGRVDLGLDTARTVVRTMRRTADRPDLREALVRGDTSIDRVEALARIGEDVGLLSHLDVSGVRAEAASRARLEANRELQSASDRFLVMQPSLDESWWKLWGGLDGPSGAIVDKVLSETADQLPALPDGSRGERSWRKATALVETMTSDQRPPAQLTVFVDAQKAAPASGTAGVRLEAGPKVGPQAIAAVLCDAVTEVIVRRDDGRYMEYGRKSRTAPTGLKKALFDKHLHMCAADGCDSRSRLEAHHVIPWAEGGSTNEENMTLLCWFHHHVVVHERGYRIARHPDHGRVRFDPPNRPT